MSHPLGAYEPRLQLRMEKARAFTQFLDDDVSLTLLRSMAEDHRVRTWKPNQRGWGTSDLARLSKIKYDSTVLRMNKMKEAGLLVCYDASLPDFINSNTYRSHQRSTGIPRYYRWCRIGSGVGEERTKTKRWVLSFTAIRWLRIVYDLPELGRDYVAAMCEVAKYDVKRTHGEPWAVKALDALMCDEWVDCELTMMGVMGREQLADIDPPPKKPHPFEGKTKREIEKMKRAWQEARERRYTAKLTDEAKAQARAIIEKEMNQLKSE